MYHRRERTTEDGTTEDSHVDFLNLIVDVPVGKCLCDGKCIECVNQFS